MLNFISKESRLFKARNTSKNDLRENIKTLVIAIFFALLFRSFAYEPFHIPSGSMKSNLLIGDYIFVSKFSYGYSRYSFPLGFPLFTGRIWETKPKRGDVVVFRPPGDPSTDFIKRLIGLPGDRIQMKGGVLYINDKPMPKEYEDEWEDTDGEHATKLKRYSETLPEGKTFSVLNEKVLTSVEDTGVYEVPEGHYFMMGDNRDHSRDSRFASPVGFVPEENLVGRAELILFSWKGGLSFRSNRFFQPIP
jgi:signal peptidase I